MVGKFETNKDLVQELTTSGAQRVGNIAALITGTVAGVAREIGEFITDAIEMKEAAAAARRDAAAAEPAYDATDDEVRAPEQPVTEAEIVDETEVVSPKPVPEQH
ncbi:MULTISPECIES: hypothetical protein [Nocardia]|uniref:Uncharacterized protein n=1 Tax=Nocardia ignorata TaxID=145285 RepID=A0A4R6PJ12_NOCIG|nr:hypothetical protein [Nocardia ignorata]TDP38378.1 hypothetical protein DFR75_10332 [Nocardia ignorata]